MSIYNLPLESDASYDFTVTLEDLEWKFTITWNTVVEAWYCRLQGLTETDIDFNFKLVCGVDLIKPFAIIQLGQLFMLDLEEENADPNFDDIGTRFVLTYADKTESSFTG
jgi:hypothetical protein